MDYGAKFPHIRLGLCCINMQLRYNDDIYTNRKKIKKQIEKQGLEVIKKSAIDNVIDLAKLLVWNKNHGIEVMRISSELVPHATNKFIGETFGEKGKEYTDLEFLRKYLEKVGHLARAEKMRLTFHPGQYCQIGSPTLSVFNATVKELEMHAKFLEMMKLGNDSIMVVHIGGVYNDKPSTIIRFKNQFNMMPKNIRDRIVLENDEKCYDAEEVLEICEDLNVPIVFDIFHYYCYGKLHPTIKQKSIDELMPRILETWKKRDIKPKFHLSEQSIDKRTGSHSVFIKEIPKEMLAIPEKYKVDIDIMIEAKGKEIAIGKLYKKYPNLKPLFAKDINLEIPKKALKELNAKDINDYASSICSSCECVK